VLGGEAEAIAARMDETWSQGLDLQGALRVAVAALSGPDRVLPAEDLEVAVLERTAERRAFRRIERADLPALLPTVEAPAPVEVPAPAEDEEPTDGPAD
jgi:proteasome alpha subunit